MNRCTGIFEANDGTKIYYESYIPKNHDRSVIIVHGYSEYIGRYKEIIAFLYKQNIAVYGMDARGHGDSEGIRGHVDAWSDYTSDLNQFVAKIKSDKPLIMLAHSMGTTIATNYIIEHRSDAVDGLILSGTTIKPVEATKSYLIVLAKILSNILPRMSVDLKLNAELTCSDPKVREASKNDPKMFSTVTTKWGTEILKAIERTKSNTHIYTMPFLMIHGGNDRINDFSAAKDFFEKIESVKKRFITYPQSYHEVILDVEKKKALNDIVEFICEIEKNI